MKVLLLYGKNENTDNPLALEYLRRFCLTDSTVEASVEFKTLSFEKNDSYNTITSKILDYSPAVVAASCYVWNTDSILHICSFVKKANQSIIIILGGPEVSHDANKICFDNPYIDAIVSGEGERTFLALLKELKAGRAPEDIGGVTYRVKDRIYGGCQPQPTDVSELPLLFNDANVGYLSSLAGKVSYETSRGCPHSCCYCDCGRMSRGTVRYFSYKRIESEIDYILRHKKVRHLYLIDSEININNNHAKTVLKIISRAIKRYRWDGAVTFHLDLSRKIDAELRDLICGVTTGIGIGVQSLNPAALRQMGRGWFDRDSFEKNAVSIEKDIRLVYQFIYGCPGDTYETFKESIKWAVNANRDVWFDRLQLLSGTAFRRHSEEFGIIYEPHRPNYVISSNTFSSEGIEQAESLKRGFILYTFRDVVLIDKLAAFLSLDSLGLLEAFGCWCTNNVPIESMIFSRLSPHELPMDFKEKIAGWIGRFLKHYLVERGIPLAGIREAITKGILVNNSLFTTEA